MDSTTHTIVALGLLAVAFYFGRYLGFNKGHSAGIASGVSYLLMYGACTEADVERANKKFDEEENYED
jgi:hypothetical protein